MKIYPEEGDLHLNNLCTSEIEDVVDAGTESSRYTREGILRLKRKKKEKCVLITHLISSLQQAFGY